MKNLPTWEDVLSFLKDNTKIIMSTIAISIVVYVLGASYTLYSNTKASNINDIDLEQGNINDAEGIILSKKELDELQKKIITFDFYVENDDALQFTNYNLLKKLLIAPNIIKIIEEKASTTINPSPDLAVNVSLDHETYLLTLSIGTGDYKLNKLISNAYYESFQDGTIPFFENKSVYLNSPPKIHRESEKEKEAKQEGTLNEENVSPSLTELILYTLIVLVGSSVLGIIISFIYAIFRKEIVDPFSTATKEEDVVLNFTSFKNISDEELTIKIKHAINHPMKKIKVLLSEDILENELVQTLNREKENQMSDLKVIVASDLSEVDPKLIVDEVILIIKKKKTTKNWYKMQRIQLENYNAAVKVIQVS